MISGHVPLARQLEMVFTELKEELSYLASGIVFVHIRNNEIGKFGIKHDPIESNDGVLGQLNQGLTDQHLRTFRKIAAQALLHKKHWTHGEIQFQFSLKNNALLANTRFESNYNMANLLSNGHSRSIR